MTDAHSGSDEPTEADGSTDPPTDRPGSALDSDRYAHLSLDDGAVVIYDRHEPDSWVQSAYHVEVGV